MVDSNNHSSYQSRSFAFWLSVCKDVDVGGPKMFASPLPQLSAPGLPSDCVLSGTAKPTSLASEALTTTTAASDASTGCQLAMTDGLRDPRSPLDCRGLLAVSTARLEAFLIPASPRLGAVTRRDCKRR